MIALACAFAIFLADQWTKRSIANRNLSWGSIVRFHFVAHREPSYERTVPRILLILTWILALAAAVLLYRYTGRFHSATALAGLGLAFGAAAGNLLDILRCRYVIDYIDLGWWPVFNLADIAILVGLAAAFLG